MNYTDLSLYLVPLVIMFGFGVYVFRDKSAESGSIGCAIMMFSLIPVLNLFLVSVGVVLFIRDLIRSIK